MTSRLTKQRFQDAKDYLFREGRPLEQELFRYHFEDGNSSALKTPLMLALAYNTKNRSKEDGRKS
jgi:hypothetical protein